VRNDAGYNNFHLQKCVSLDLWSILHEALIAIPTEQAVNDYCAAAQELPSLFPIIIKLQAILFAYIFDMIPVYFF